MSKFRKKPVVIEAYQLPLHPDSDSVDQFAKWALDIGLTGTTFVREGMIIETLEGDMLASHGDWIIKGIKGEFYPCKPEIFAETYEEVTDL